MWPFSRNPVVEPEMAEWMLDHAEWLLTAHSHSRAFAAAQLLPVSDRVFPKDGLEGHALAQHLFAKVLAYTRMSSMNVMLVPDEQNSRFRNRTGNIFHVQPKSGAAGTYRHGEQAEITYDTELLERPESLITVLAHEVAHAVLHLEAASPPPSETDFNELLTDFTKVFLGFGLYHIVHRRPINAYSLEIANEYRDLYVYYMNRSEGCFATALFCVIHDVDSKLAVRGCIMEARATLKRAFADLEPHRSRIAEIRADASQTRAFASRITAP